MQPQTRTVLLDDAPTPMGARAFDLLLALASRPGEVVGKDALLEIVWPGVVVEENNLQVQVCALRKLLGPSVIMTVPGRGYAFTAKISSAQAEDSDSTAAGSGPMDAGLNRLRGRELELRAIHELLGAQRLITVTGPGGVGKTRLTRAAVPAHKERFTGGIWRVDLASVHAGAPVAEQIFDVLGLARHGPAREASELAQLLPSRPMLLVLENCEHLIWEVRALAHELLEHVPTAHMLLTSQAPLKLPGEHVLRLEPLEVPPTRHSGEALDTPAVALFFDTVEALHSQGEPGRGDVEDATSICRHLDGMPLAIELAASRVPVLGISGVRRRLGNRFQMLTAPAGLGQPQGERSVAAGLHRSWQLLTAREQAVLQAVSRFKGQFTLGMAMNATVSVGLSEWDAMDVLGALADKSMLAAAPGRHAAFRVLETTRLFVQGMAGDSLDPATAVPVPVWPCPFEPMCKVCNGGVWFTPDACATKSPGEKDAGNGRGVR